MNRGAEEQYGWTLDQAMGRNPHALLGTPDDQVATFMVKLQRDHQ